MTKLILWCLSLQRNIPPTCFQGVSFCIYCLGDRAYGEQFCAAGRKVAVRLLQLGAKLVSEIGYGDDGTPNGGVFCDLDDWLEKLQIKLLELGVNKEHVASTTKTVALPYRIERSLVLSGNQTTGMEWEDPAFEAYYRAFFGHLQPPTVYQYDSALARLDTTETAVSRAATLLRGRLSENRRLTDPEWSQNTRHLRFEVSSSEQETRNGTSDQSPYRAGDVAVLWPENSQIEVERFLKVLPLAVHRQADDVLQLERNPNASNHFVSCDAWPRQCTLRGWLTWCADICALPEREDLRALAAYCSPSHDAGATQGDKLLGLSTTAEAALYADYILREKRSWADVLYDFDSLRDEGSLLSVEALLALLSPIRPREFSIASSPTQEASNDSERGASFGIELCVAVLEGRTPLGRSYHGLCSHYLASLEPGNVVRMWIRPGTFQGLPLELSSGSFTVPVLCIGAGTGVAPLRGLILEREAVRKSAVKGFDGDANTSNEPHSTPDDVLVFGCRKKSADFYYEAEWRCLVDEGRLHLLTAFSQDQWHKMYVQQVLKKANSESRLIVKHLIERSGAVYIAGGPKMARSVKDELVEIVASEMGGDAQRAKQLLVSLQRIGRFSIEAWS